MNLRRWLPTAALTALSVVTAVSMCRVFGGWDFLTRLVVVVLVAHGVAVLLRRARVPGPFAVLMGLGTVVIVVSYLYYPGTQWFVLPSWTTVDNARLDLGDAWSQVGIAVPPVSAFGGFGVAAALALGIAAVAADAFAFRAHGRVEALVPAGVVFVAVSAVGIDRNRAVVTVIWLASALVFVAVARAAAAVDLPGWIGQRTSVAWARWVSSGVTLAVVAAVAAGVVGPRLPGAGAEPLLDPDVHDGDGVTEVVSPLVDIRGRLVSQSDTVLFTVDAGSEQYWRLSGLPEFDGRVWGLPDRQLDEAGGSLDTAQPFERRIEQSVRIEALGGNLAPVAFSPTELRNTDIDLYFLQDTSTLVVTGDGLQQGVEYEIVSSMPDPSIETLRSSSAGSPPSPVYASLPDDWDEDLTRIAEGIVGDAPTAYDQARALQDWFRANFEYTLDVPSGHSVQAIEEFLDRRSGYCEQFAGTFAAFARSLGIPARVAVGFTPGERGGDGRYRVRSRHAHAWPEVWFDDIGWVIFEPTPGRGAPGAEPHTGVPAEQDSTPAASPDEPDVAPTTTSAPNGTATTAPRNPDRPTPEDVLTGEPVVVPRADDGTSPLWWLVLALVVAVLVWSLAMPRVVASMARRTRRSDDDWVLDVWNATLATVSMCGVAIAPGDTPLESARQVARQSGIDRRELKELAVAATTVIYGHQPLDNDTLARCRAIGEHVLASAHAILPWSTKILVRVDPRVARRTLVV